MTSHRSTRWRLVAVLGVAVLLVASCGGDDDDAAESSSTTASESASGSSTTKADRGGDGDVDEEFCAALSADLDAIDAIVDSFDGSGGPSDDLVQTAQDANDALRDATPDSVEDDAKAIYEPLGDLLDKLESGDTGNIQSEYASAVGTPAFTGPLTSLAQKCATFGNG